MDKDERKKLQRKAKGRGIAVEGEGGYRRHVLLCAGPQCCPPEEGAAAWKYLDRTTRQLTREGCPVYASRVGCLFFCRGGPLAVVYPEGTWYAHADLEGCRKIVEEHLREGRPVQEMAFARNPLRPKADADEEPSG